VSVREDPRFDALVGLITEVKPSLATGNITPESRLVDDLGLDSLDVLQLSRKIVRRLEATFDLDEWEEGAPTHRRSVRSLLDHLDAEGTA
jgi:acyl carrier protein